MLHARRPEVHPANAECKSTANDAKSDSRKGLVLALAPVRFGHIDYGGKLGFLVLALRFEAPQLTNVSVKRSVERRFVTCECQ